ncbi:MAG: PEP-CTERM sorting domain-containing protein [Sedimentisphaerales bacterium]|nr:PEP-CTERM sorting domain-containing protein [Sedimentisphaerales bacterium]
MKMNLFKTTVICSLVLLISMAGNLSAALIYESATMGTPGQSVYGHMLLGHTQFGGVRFELTSTMQVDAIGGHFATYYPGGSPNLFGALISLTGETDVPDSSNLSTPDVLRTVAFDPTGTSSDHIIDIDPVLLSPGWYAVVFGAGLHGAVTGFDNSAQLNNSPVGSPKYLTWNSSGWSFSSSTWPRYTVYGEVPEPMSLGLLGLGGLVVLVRRRWGA